MSKGTPSARRLAARVVQRVLDEGAYSHLALDAALTGAALDPRDRGLATELVYGTLTWLGRIDAILAPRLSRGMDELDPEVRAILRVAVYQLAFLDRVPDHAVVHEAVEHARKVRGRRKVDGFVNGVLRATLRARSGWPTPVAFEADPVEHIVQRWSLPGWLAEGLVGWFGPDEALALAEGLTRRPGVTLRVTGAATAAEARARAEALAEALGGRPGALSPGAVVLERLDDAAREALDQGRAVVQDEGAQLVGWLSAPSAGQRVLDACAGLGGKTAHLAELTGPDGEVLAIDDDGPKLDVLARTLKALKLPPARCLVGDFRHLDAQVLGGPFDVVVLDAPCSGLGVLRRHPEVRWRRGTEDLAALAQIQAGLLERAVEALAPGGALIYSVCTFTAQEGPAQIDALLAAHPELEADPTPPPEIPWARLRPAGAGWMTLPHQHEADGFFMARLRRRGET